MTDVTFAPTASFLYFLVDSEYSLTYSNEISNEIITTVVAKCCLKFLDDRRLESMSFRGRRFKELYSTMKSLLPL